MKNKILFSIKHVYPISYHFDAMLTPFRHHDNNFAHRLILFQDVFSISAELRNVLLLLLKVCLDTVCNTIIDMRKDEV